MAVYKVIQDIEAEDKVLGPLSFKSLVYAIIAGSLLFICIRLGISNSPSSIKWAVIIVLFFPIAVFGILAAPIGKDQPTEVWILSHIRFLTQGHKKVWDQTGLSELVTVTAPKLPEKQLTKDFSQEEVKSRLKALAATLDSRGWAVKNVAVDIYPQPSYISPGGAASDRLVGVASVAQPPPVLDVHLSDDIMDEQNNATAQTFNQLMQEADAKRKQAMLDKFNAAREAGQSIQSGSVDYRFLDEHSALTPGTGGSTFVGANLTVPTENAEDMKDKAEETAPKIELGDPKLREHHQHFKEKPSLAEERRLAQEQQRVIEEQKQITAQKQEQLAQEVAAAQQNTVTAQTQAVKMELAQSGNDLTVASIAKLANHNESVEQISPNEVVLHLH